MDWQPTLHSGRSTDRKGDRPVQFIPAEKGWLALFEETTAEGLKIHADPVIAWRLCPQDRNEKDQPMTSGQAVVGASPWLEKADSERAAHFFALVREDQLDPEFLAELKRNAMHTRQDLMVQALRNHESRNEGHASWRRQRRGGRNEKATAAQFGLFAI